MFTRFQSETLEILRVEAADRLQNLLSCLVCLCVTVTLVVFGIWALARQYEPTSHIGFVQGQVIEGLDHTGERWRVDLGDGEMRVVASPLKLRLRLEPGTDMCLELRQGRLSGDERLAFVLWHDACGIGVAASR